MIVPPEGPDRMLSAEQARLFALHAMVSARWEYDGDPELSPLKGALVLAAGWQEFRADLMRELDAINRMHPDLIGRENWDPVCHAVWRRLKRRLFAWSMTTMGRPMTPRQVIKAYERYHRKQQKVTLTDAKFTIEDGGRRTGQETGWASSGLMREGTIEDFVRDIRDEDGKLRAARDLEEGLEAEKRGE